MENILLVIGNKNYSTWSLRAWLALVKSGVCFEERQLALDTTEFYEQIAEYSPVSQVPVLCIGEHRIHDSLAIAETVNDCFTNGSLLPTDPMQRAEARALCAEMHSGFHAVRNAMPMNIRAVGRRVEHSESIAREIARINAIWNRAEPGRWLFGEFSIVDAMYAPVVLRFPTYGVELNGRAARYQQTVINDPDVQRWIAESSAETDIVEADEAGL